MAHLRKVIAAPAIERRTASRERIEAMRDLPARFPRAMLRPCTVARAPELDERAGGRVWIALESMQITGSFKVRGALVAVSEHAARGVTNVVAVSAGNHGAALAYASKVLGVRATIFVPRTAATTKQQKIRAYGADLRVLPTDSYDEAETHAIDYAAKNGVPFVSPYDDEDIVLGNGASLGFEIAAAIGRDPDVVIAPFGGGGLATGLAWALGKSRVWGVESEASPSMSMSLARGAAVTRLDATTPTIAEGLEGGITESAYDRAARAIAGVAVVSEQGLADALAYAYRKLGVVIEGSAAASLAPIVDGALPQEMRGADVAIVLTGRNVDDDRVARVLSSSR